MKFHLQYFLIGLPMGVSLWGTVALGENIKFPLSIDRYSVDAINHSLLRVQNNLTELSDQNRIENCPELENHLKPSPLVQIQLKPNGDVVQNNSTLLDSSQLKKILQPILQQDNLSELELKTRLANGVTLQYLVQGLITSSAEVIELTPELIVIQIREGQIIEIQLEGRERLNQSYICNRLLLGVTSPFNTLKLEEQLRLFRSNPLLENIEASLRPSGNPGESILRVKIKESSSFLIRFGFDNDAPPSIGSEQLGVGLSYLNLTGMGDSFAASYQRSTTGGADILDVSYQLPLNAMNGTLQLRIAPYWTEITQPPFDQLDIQGQTDRYQLFYRQPLIRSVREEFALSVGFSYQDGQTFVFEDRPFPFGFGPDEEGISRTSVFTFTQEYINRDPKGAWLLKSEFGLGTGLFDATDNSGSIPDGQFFKWLGQAQRVQQINPDMLLILQAELQLSADSLLPAQQFILGGGQSLRGFRQNVRSGDNGFRLSVENRLTVARNSAGSPIIQLAPFLDMGAVWNLSNNPNQIPEENVIAGAGLGVLWGDLLGIHGLSLRLDYALPLVEIEDRGNNIQDDGLYFKINYQPRF